MDWAGAEAGWHWSSALAGLFLPIRSSIKFQTIPTDRRIAGHICARDTAA